VKLFQSTLLSGLAVRVFMVGQPAEQAVLGQVLFMGCAMWAYAWPWVPYMTTQELHEKRMESKYSRQEKIRLRLSIAARTKDVELAEKSAAQLRELYSQADLKHAEVPTQKQGVSSTEYAKTLYDYSMKNPAFPKRHSELIASSMLGVVAVTTTVMATYLFTETFSGKLKLGGFNWADWNLTHVPKGDGVVSIAIKSAILTAVFWEGQRLFNWAWDELQLKRRGLSEEKRKELTERRDKAKKLALDFGPTRVAIKLGERPAKLAATAVGVPAKYVASKVEKPVKRAFEVVAEPTNRVIEAVKEPAKRMTGAIAEPTKRAFNAVAEPTKKAITAVKEPVKKIYEAVKKPVKQGYEVAVKQPVEFGYKAAERPIKGLLKAGEKSVELAITGSGKVYNAGEKSVKVAKKAGGVAIGSCRSIFQRFSGK
jgi:hypothetical protein